MLAIATAVLAPAPTAASTTSASASAALVAPMANVVPGAPTGVTAVPGNAQATVSWVAPAPNGGTAITRYTATSSPGSKTCTSTSATTCTVTGVTNGTAYTFKVVARNTAGNSVASAASDPVTPRTVPGAPTGVTATAGNASANVSWVAPASNGGAPITGYTATSSPDSRTCTASATTCTVTGLANGTAYTFRVVATNAAGSSSSSTQSAAVTPTAPPDVAPGAPTGVTAVPGDGQAAVSWVAPQPNGGSAITGYTVTANPGGQTCSTTGETACVVSGLANGTPYAFAVVARNAVGSSAPSDPSEPVTPRTVPGAPTGVTAVPGDAQAAVSWAAPQSDGGTAVTDFTVTADPGGRTCSTTGDTSCVVSGLDNGTPYSFTVVARNAVGSSAPSDPSEPVTPRTVPGAPTGVVATAGNGAAELSWKAPASDGGSPITGYTATSSPAGASCTSGADSTGCTVSDLVNGTEYTFRVVAHSAVGSSDPSSPSDAVTPDILPDAPTDVTAVPGNEEASVTWGEPAPNGGSTITGYTVTADPGGQTCSTTGDTNCAVSGLENGTEYAFTVAARNEMGAGTASSPSEPVVPRTSPDPPTGVGAAPADGLATVTWTAPANDGGSPITSYAVVSAPISAGCSVTHGTSCVVTGLTNGTAYVFRVAASNLAGTSDLSAPSDSATPVTVPGVPSGVAATAGNGSAQVSWTAPEADGGGPITGYTVIAEPGGKECTTTGETSCTVGDLVNGLAYTFSVTAANAAGTSTPSWPSGEVTPRTVPGAPSSVTSVPGDRSATVSWTAPDSDGGAPITGFTVTAEPDGASCTTSHDTSCTVTGLHNGTAYSFTVAAGNVAGSSAQSEPSEEVTPRTVPDAPAGVRAAAGNGSADVSWEAPASDGGARVTGYTVIASPGAGRCSTSVDQSCTVLDLKNGVTYSFTVLAANVAGWSALSESSDGVTPRTVPDTPTGVSAAPGDASASVSWVAPGGDGGSPITGYTVTSRPGGHKCSTTGDTSCTISSLDNGTAYAFTVVAHNAAGDSADSVLSDHVIPRTVPGVPTKVSAAAGDSSAEVSWRVPASDGGSPITEYTATARPGGSACTSTGEPSCTVTGLENGKTYTFTVLARNAVGVSPESDPSDEVTARTVPGSPTGVSAAPGDSAAEVTWTAPGTDGGAAITGYLVTSSPDHHTCTGKADATACTADGLKNGTSYTFTVVAQNDVGSSAASEPSAEVTPRTVPSAPTGVGAAAGNASAQVTWKPPASDGGAPVAGYRATARPGGRTCTSIEGTSCTVSGLANGTAYSFTVVAQNVAGSSVESEPSAGVTPTTVPGAPTGVSAKAAKASAAVRWVAPTKDGGSPITSYTVTANPGGRTCITKGTTTCAVTGLTNGKPYRFTVVAGNAAGKGPVSGASAAVTPTLPTVKVAVTTDAAKDKLSVNVDPNKGSGYWTFKVQKKSPIGTWSTLPTTYQTDGDAETKSLNLGKGTYRVVVAPKYDYLGTTSSAVTLAK